MMQARANSIYSIFHFLFTGRARTYPKKSQKVTIGASTKHLLIILQFCCFYKITNKCSFSGGLCSKVAAASGEHQETIEDAEQCQRFW
jgi:hypothetical protein